MWSKTPLRSFRFIPEAPKHAVHLLLLLAGGQFLVTHTRMCHPSHVSSSRHALGSENQAETTTHEGLETDPQLCGQVAQIRLGPQCSELGISREDLPCRDQDRAVQNRQISAIHSLLSFIYWLRHLHRGPYEYV